MYTNNHSQIICHKINPKLCGTLEKGQIALGLSRVTEEGSSPEANCGFFPSIQHQNPLASPIQCLLFLLCSRCQGLNLFSTLV